MPTTVPVQQLPPASPLGDGDTLPVGQGPAALNKATLQNVVDYLRGKLPPGRDGVDGNTIHYGDVPPVLEFGSDGDFYIDRVAHKVYGPKTVLGWPAGASMLGGDTPLDDAISAADPGATTVTRSAKKISDDLAAAVAPLAHSADVADEIAAAVAPLAPINDAAADDAPTAGFFTRSAAKIAGLLAAAVAPLARAVITRANLAATTQTGLPVYLWERRRQGWFNHYTAAEFLTDFGVALADVVAADTAQGLVVDDGSGGAWVRQFDATVKAGWFGLIRGENAGANAATNDAAFTAMFAALLALSPSVGGKHAITDVDLGYGVIEISSTITPIATCRMFGRGTGHWVINIGTYAGTVVRPYGCTGFSLAQSRSSLSDVAVQGNMAVGTAESEQHGVSITQTTFCNRVKVRSMPGDGFNIDGKTSSGHLPDGTSLVDCEAWSCRDGLSIGVTGGNGDANVIRVEGGFFQSNRRWGVNDQGFLGNFHAAWEGAGNGTQARNDGVDIAATMVFYGIAQGGSINGLYVCIAGQEPWASLNPPSGDGTDNQGWYFKATAAGPTSGRPTWFNGMLVRAGGILYTNNINAPHVFQGCYAEADQGFAQTVHPTHIYGGTLARYVWKGSSGVAEFIDTNGIKNLSAPLLIGGVGGPYTGTDETINAVMGEVSATKTLFKFSSSVGAPSAWRLKFTSGTTGGLLFDYGNSSSTTCYQILGPNTTDQAGTGAARPYAFRPTILLVSPNSTLQSDNARRLMIDSTVPASGAHGIGEHCLNRTSDGTQPFAWRNLAQSTPGTWQALYSGYGTNQIGYAIGAGNTATQLTSRATGVTINKLTGKISLFSATTTAGQLTQFTLTNSQLGATDTIDFTQLTGAGFYIVNAKNNGDGTATVNVYTPNAVAVAETVAFQFNIIKGTQS